MKTPQEVAREVLNEALEELASEDPQRIDVEDMCGQILEGRDEYTEQTHEAVDAELKRLVDELYRRFASGEELPYADEPY